MSGAELNTLHTICEVERTQLLSNLAMSVKILKTVLTQNPSNYLYVECSTAWLYGSHRHLSPLYIAEQCYDKIPVNYLDIVMYVDPITRQAFENAN